MAPTKLPGLRLYSVRPTLNVRCFPKPVWSAVTGPESSSTAVSVAKLNRPELPVTFTPTRGSTMLRVLTAEYRLWSPFCVPASVKMPEPSMKNGRFSG